MNRTFLRYVRAAPSVPEVPDHALMMHGDENNCSSYESYHDQEKMTYAKTSGSRRRVPQETPEVTVSYYSYTDSVLSSASGTQKSFIMSVSDLLPIIRPLQTLSHFISVCQCWVTAQYIAPALLPALSCRLVTPSNAADLDLRLLFKHGHNIQEIGITQHPPHPS